MGFCQEPKLSKHGTEIKPARGEGVQRQRSAIKAFFQKRALSPRRLFASVIHIYKVVPENDRKLRSGKQIFTPNEPISQKCSV